VPGPNDNICDFGTGNIGYPLQFPFLSKARYNITRVNYCHMKGIEMAGDLFIKDPITHLAEISIEDIEYLYNEYVNIMEDGDDFQTDVYYTLRRIYNSLRIIHILQNR